MTLSRLIPVIVYCGLAACQLAVAARAVEIVDATVERKNGLYRVSGTSIVNATPEFVFATLMDYDNFHKLAGGIAESRFVDSDVEGELLGYTRIESCVLFYCRSVEKLERIEPTPNAEIRTVAVPDQSDFEINRTRWIVEPDGTGTRLTYEAEFDPDFWMPPLIDTWAIKKKLVRTAELIGMRIEWMAENNLTLAQVEEPADD